MTSLRGFLLSSFSQLICVAWWVIIYIYLFRAYILARMCQDSQLVLSSFLLMNTLLPSPFRVFFFLFLLFSRNHRIYESDRVTPIHRIKLCVSSMPSISLYHCVIFHDLFCIHAFYDCAQFSRFNLVYDVAHRLIPLV